MQQDTGKRDICKINPRPIALDLLVCPEVEENLIWEANRDIRAMLLRNRTGKKIIPIVELVLNVEGIRVLWVLEKQRIQHRQHRLALPV